MSSDTTQTPATSAPRATTTAREAAAALDRCADVALSRLTGGLSPISLGLAWADWAWHLAAAPGTMSRLAAQAQTAALEALAAAPEAPLRDPRFKAEEWKQAPFAHWARLHEATQAWWRDATALPGMTPHHHDMVDLFARQILDMVAPSNWLPTNPQALARTAATGGANLVKGATQAADDWRQSKGLPALNRDWPAYRPGHEVAVTPGDVVHRNDLVELIQYRPATAKVQREPVFIVPSWIMKYYILDLSPQNSMVRYLVEQGHTVYIVSWRNPDERDALLDMTDYLQLGILDPLAAVGRMTGGVPVHTAGYCLGGTLLAIAAAAVSRPRGCTGSQDLPPLASVTLMAAQVDFREPGELSILTDEAQVRQLESMMAERGFLSGQQMAGSFQFLHARDLIWTARMRSYLLGEPDAPNDLMAWNADLTRMPATMHAEYLRALYLKNDLADGRYLVDGDPVSVHDVKVPFFVVGTAKDHVSPWHSVYKIHQLADGDITFVLTSGGHNAGIISEPGHANRRYQMLTRHTGEHWMSPQAWQAAAPTTEGSWWTAWHEWLVAHGEGEVRARRVSPSASLGEAPGEYVHICYED